MSDFEFFLNEVDDFVQCSYFLLVIHLEPVYNGKMLWRCVAEITMFDNYIIVYKFIHDLHFFVTGGDEENELILASVLQGFFDAVGLLLRYYPPCHPILAHRNVLTSLFNFHSEFCVFPLF